MSYPKCHWSSCKKKVQKEDRLKPIRPRGLKSTNTLNSLQDLSISNTSIQISKEVSIKNRKVARKLIRMSLFPTREDILKVIGHRYFKIKRVINPFCPCFLKPRDFLLSKDVFISFQVDFWSLISLLFQPLLSCSSISLSFLRSAFIVDVPKGFLLPILEQTQEFSKLIRHIG